MDSKEENFLNALPQMYYLLENAIRQKNDILDELCFYDKTFIYERNVTYEVEEYAPGYIAFADDNGDMRYLISKNDTDHNIYMADAGDLTIDSSCKVADSAEDFVERFYEINNDDSAEYCNIIWKYLDDDIFSTSSIIKIKKCLKLSDSVGEILGLSRNLPQIIKGNVMDFLAENMLNDLGALASMFEIEKI